MRPVQIRLSLGACDRLEGVVAIVFWPTFLPMTAAVRATSTTSFFFVATTPLVNPSRSRRSCVRPCTPALANGLLHVGLCCEHTVPRYGAGFIAMDVVELAHLGRVSRVGQNLDPVVDVGVELL